MGGKVLCKVSALGMLLNSLFWVDHCFLLRSWWQPWLFSHILFIQVSPKPQEKSTGCSEASLPAAAQLTNSGELCVRGPNKGF